MENGAVRLKGVLDESWKNIPHVAVTPFWTDLMFCHAALLSLICSLVYLRVD